MKISKYFAVFVLLGSGAVAETRDSWALSPEQAACVFENLHSYRDVEDEPVVIFVLACPEADRVAALQQLQQNSAQPKVIVAPDGTPLDEVIVYSQAELACLQKLAPELSNSPVLLPQKPCD